MHLKRSPSGSIPRSQLRTILCFRASRLLSNNHSNDQDRNGREATQVLTNYGYEGQPKTASVRAMRIIANSSVFVSFMPSVQARDIPRNEPHWPEEVIQEIKRGRKLQVTILGPGGSEVPEQVADTMAS